MGTCEFLMVLSILSDGGGSSLISECQPSVSVCQNRIKELIGENGEWSSDGYAAQCVEIGGLVDAGRK